jgi:hypothetical protein
VTVVLAIGLALSSGALGAFGAMWAMLRTERNRQAFERQQDSRRLRAQTMKAARILDSVLQEAEALLQTSVVKHNQLWVDSLEAPDVAVWPELRGDIADILDPSAWIAVNVGFLAVDHMRDFAVGYRKPGHDDTTEFTPRQKETFAPIIRDISAAREALRPVAYPDHIRLPAGHPMLALLAEQQASDAPAAIAGSSPPPRRFWQRR